MQRQTPPLSLRLRHVPTGKYLTVKGQGTLIGDDPLHAPKPQRGEEDPERLSNLAVGRSMEHRWRRYVARFTDAAVAAVLSGDAHVLFA